MDQVLNTLFVYGTLKHDFHNHHILSDHKSVCLGNYILRNFMMVHQGVPAVIPDPGSTVKGELYTISVDTLKRTDYLESEGEYYLRKELEVFLDVDYGVRGRKAWVYIGAPKYWSKNNPLCKVNENGFYYWS